MAKTVKRLTGASSKIEKAVQTIVNRHSRDYDNANGFLRDLQYGGCQSGLVGELVYYTDTTKFYKRHKTEIGQLLRDMLDDTGYHAPADLFRNQWDHDDPLAEEANNQNLLAWFAFEQTAYNLGRENGIEL